MMPELASVFRRLSVVLAGAVVASVSTAAVAQASYGEIGHFGGKAGPLAGEFEPSFEANDIGVNPGNNSVYVVDLPDEKNEFRIQKFEAKNGSYEAVASVKFKPVDDEKKEEEWDTVEGVAVAPTEKRIYVLASEPRGAKTTSDEGDYAAAELYAFSTEQSGSKLVPVAGTTEGVLAGTKVLNPLSNTAGQALIEPAGITVDPVTHDVILLAQEDKGGGEEPVDVLQQITAGGALGERYVDTTDYLEDEATSPVVSANGNVYVDDSGQDEIGEIDQIPTVFSSETEPTPLFRFEDNIERGEPFEKLTRFPGSPISESGGSLSIGEEGTVYTKASVGLQNSKDEITGFYPGVLEFASTGVEEGWTGGQNVASGGGECAISYSGGTEPAIAAGKNHDVFVYDDARSEPKIIEFGPGGSGCPTASVSEPVATVLGKTVSGLEPIPRKDEVTLSSSVTQANALKVEWNFGDGTETTIEAPQYQSSEVTHHFAKSGPLEITEKVYTDDLATPVIEAHRKVDVLVATPTASTGEGKSVAGSETAQTLTGTVNPNDESVTECKFEYGTTSAYGKSVACAQTASSLGKGTIAKEVSAAITGLGEHSTYHFRLVAKNAGGASEGADVTFATGPYAPGVTTGVGSGSATTATLNAKVDPEGQSVTACYFQYGPSEAYGSQVPCTSLPEGTGSSELPVSAQLAGLTASSSYDFRIVATNATGTTYGENASFTTSVATTGGGGGGGGSGGSSSGGGGSSSGGGSGGGGGGGTPTGGGEVLANKVVQAAAVPDVVIVGGASPVSTSGTFTVKLSCPAGESTCSGTVTLKTLKAVVASVGHVAKAKSKAAILTLATGSFTVAGGQTKTVTLRLSSSGRTLLARSHMLSARATIVAHDPAGSSHITVVTLTLRPAKKAAKKH
jgi:hypothetical protein